MPEKSKYREDLPRVSNLVSSLYPFSGTEAEKRFHGWLSSKQIPIDTYMNVANEAGTEIHAALEYYINNGVLPECRPELTKYVSFGIQFLKDYDVKDMQSEQYICTDYYQGTIDLLGTIGKHFYVLDWKSWGIAHELLGTRKPGGKYKKPYDKLSKARLQLSLYAAAIGIENIGVIELAEDGYHFHKLKVIPKEELDIIVSKLCKNIGDK